MSWRSGGSWRVALKLARRDVWRAKGRSALVVAMIGVPIMLIAAGSVLLRSTTDTNAADGLRTMGPTDAVVTVQGAPLAQTFDGALQASVPEAKLADPDDQDMTSQRVAALTGGTAIPVRHGTTLVKTDLGAIAVNVREFDLRDERTTGLGTVVDGRAPKSADEIAVSPNLVDDGFGPGQRIRFGAGDHPEVWVVGVVRNPADLSSRQLVGIPGSILRGAGGSGDTTYLIDTHGRAITWPDVQQLNTHGLVVQSRAVLQDPPPHKMVPRLITDSYPSTPDATLVAFTVLVAAGVLLEVVLLAGPAFAVGARRQSRQLALFVATGGTPRDVRRVVLAQGIVLGFGSAFLGILLAIALVALTRPISSQLIGHDISSLRISPLDLGALLVVGSLAALAAAYIPARHASRQDTVVALAGRPRRGGPALGLVLMVVGAIVVLALGRQPGGEWRVAVGTFVLVAGTIMITPVLIGLLNRLGGRLPLSLRLATRDGARHQSRTVPAVAAIMGVVTGVTALAIGSSSDFEQNRRGYEPRTAMETMTIGLTPTATPRAADTLADQVRAELPGRTTLLLPSITIYPSDPQALTAALVGPKCPEEDPYGCGVPLDTEDGESIIGYTTTVDGMMVAGPDLVAKVLGHPLTAEQRQVLSAGGVLVPSKAALYPDHTAQVATFRIRNGSDGSVTTRDVERTQLPAAVLAATVRHSGTYTYLADLIATPQTARRLGLLTTVHSIVVPPGSPAVSKAQEAQVKEIVQGLGYGSDIYVERGFVQTYAIQFLALSILGGLLVLVGAATATALALNDARPDFATLAAVGATPRTRRRMAMAQAAVIGGLGALLGVVVGAVPGLAVTWPLTTGEGQ
ncbi:FtsX-like permease family protein [Actinopolymorpha pittospori]|uniref:ABC transport system permease protein n=1 Tax=Actinopolymorpha pittospori TaxID=648752 RepID=A0A927MUS0_9ACTN|nr:FtsX-like permease family protein [Actinopolymorpha pittospori]MBE1607280.1 putative ABC transport system permease protein [Actinopolymorpha pittospori]